MNSANDDDKPPCDMCGAPVHLKGYELLTHSGTKVFCCEGCQGVYAMLNGDQLLAATKSPGQQNK